MFLNAQNAPHLRNSLALSMILLARQLATEMLYRSFRHWKVMKEGDRHMRVVRKCSTWGEDDNHVHSTHHSQAQSPTEAQTQIQRH